MRRMMKAANLPFNLSEWPCAFLGLRGRSGGLCQALRRACWVEVDVFVHTYRLVEVGYDGVRHACYSYEYGYEVPGISSEHTQSSGSMHPPPTAFERAECKLSLMLRLIGYYCRYQTDAGIRRAIYSRKQASDLQMYCSG